MKKGTKHIAFIISVISIALIGLISLQVYLLFVSYEQKEQAFNRNVLNAMSAVSQKLEVDEAAGRIFNILINTTDAKPAKHIVRKLHDTAMLWINTPPQKSERIIGDSDKKVRVEIFESHGFDTITTQKRITKKPSAVSFSYGYKIDGDKMEFNSRMNDSAWSVYIDSSSTKRKELVSKVVDKLTFIEQLPLSKRVNMKKLDSSLVSSFSQIGIDLPFTFAVFVGKHDSVGLRSDSVSEKTLYTSPLKTQLFVNDVMSPRYELAVSFPDRASFVLKEMTLLIALSVLFIGIIIASFIHIIRTIYSQKRFGESVINFINNMTHEFKTPISTIALAAEAIAKPTTLKSKTKLLKYNTVIADENVRMKRQVDKILQMAVLEDGEFELKRTAVNIHDMVEQAVKNISLQVEHRNGSIETNLNAQNCIVNGDAVHLTNIIHNVLDNANKYSPEKPLITVVTLNDGDKIVLTVEDQGVGISKEHLERVFDKYFRVPTGNMHDVKGFGLGLSYVKLIVEAHGGMVTLDSKEGKGTTVRIILPFDR